MTFMVPLMLFGAPLAIFLLFAFQRSRRVVIGGIIGAWLFLPVATLPLPGLPQYSKVTAAAVGVLAAVLLFDSARLLAFRPRWVDLPVAAWCLGPFFTSLSNDLGAYDGLSAVFFKVLELGVPYLMGRLYITGAGGLRDLALGIVIGGIVYVPLCLLEVRLSPQLHIWVYGYHQHSFLQTIRFGGWRPTVFMQHGLAVGMWMATASLLALWLRISGAVRTLWKVPFGWWVALLFGTTVLCKSAGSLILLAAGVGVLLMLRWRRALWPVLILLAIPPLYVGLRMSGSWSAKGVVDLASQVSQERAGSLDYRLRAEDLLVRHALQRPILGWGGWGRNRPARFDDTVEDIATDGLWIIVLGIQGVVGLTAFLAFFLVPVGLFVRRIPASLWSHPGVAAGSGLAVALLLYLLDNLMNALINPVFIVSAGALVSAALGVPARRAQARVPATGSAGNFPDRTGPPAPVWRPTDGGAA